MLKHQTLLNQNQMDKKKRLPAAYQPPDCNLQTVANYANKNNLSAVRIYQLYQEEKIEIITIDGKQYVKTPKN